MKIVFMNDGIHAYATGAPTAVGGAERQQWYLARALAAAGWKVIVGVREALQAGERRTVDGVEFVGVEHGQVLVSWHRLLLAERPDWWYWRGADHLYGPTVGLAKLAGVGTIFSAAFDRDLQPRRALSWRRRWWPLYAWGLSWTDRILVQHAGQLSAIQPRWRSKAHIIQSLALAPAHVKPHADRQQYVAWIAMLRQPKRPDVLIEIVRRLPTMRFVVCGGPSTHRSPDGYSERICSALEALPNIECLGQVAPEKALEIVANAAMLLCTSDEEGFPNTFLEAWATGTPVVSVKVDPDGVIEQRRLGAVSGSVEGVVRDIETLAGAPHVRDGIGRRARQYVTQFHSAAVVVSAFEQALQGVRS